MIPYTKHSISTSDIDAVVEVLKSDCITRGPKTELFEQTFAKFVNSKYAVTFNSASTALSMAVASLICGGDIITTPNSFIATTHAIVNNWATPRFIDVDEWGNMSIEALKLYIARNYHTNDGILTNNETGEHLNAILPVHFAGRYVDIKAIRDIVGNDVIIIEDCAHILYHEELGKYSDACVFSFHPAKHITTGEGGMITLNDSSVYEILKSFRNNGILRHEPTDMKVKRGFAYSYDVTGWGLNLHMSEINAALGLSQLMRIDEIIQRRQDIAKVYKEMLPDAIETPDIDESHTVHLYTVKLKDFQTRNELYHYLHDNGVMVQVHYYPIPMFRYLKQMSTITDDISNANDWFERSLSLPCFNDLTFDQICAIVSLIMNFFSVRSTNETL